mmetsp:Transcript_17976/g.35151  ORF Transcript_17976/g.35151 Transcript_17976/m.35151 type:complete len:232 (-) Transcript_17976:367-1062(-)
MRRRDVAAELPTWANTFSQPRGAPAELPLRKQSLHHVDVRGIGGPLKVHATARLSCTLDLTRLCNGFVNCMLSQRPNAALAIRMRKPSSIIKLSELGGVDFIGICSVDEAHQALKQVARRCVKCGFHRVKFKSFHVQQVSWVGECDLQSSINLLELARRPGAEASLGASRPHVRVPCHSMDDNNVQHVHAKVFASGKLSFSGAQTEEQLWCAWNYLKPELDKYRCKRLDIP